MRLAAAAALTGLAAFAAPAFAAPVSYEADGQAFEGWFVPASGPSKGLVVIVHDWDGLTEYEQTRAAMLSELGYDAFALDLFGAGVRPDTMDARRAATGALYADREAMRARLVAGLEAARAQGAAQDAVVMGYCFGGAATLEFARSGLGEGVAGWASFHGGVATPEGQAWAPGTAPVLILHGGADQNPTMAEVAQLTVELEAAQVTYDVEVYSGAPHAFTVFGSDRYRERADMKSWAAFTAFLDETLAATD